MGLRRTVALTLLGLVSLSNALLLVALLTSLLRGEEKSGGQLLLKAVTVWSTNVVAFGLWYWSFDRGGPVRRLQADPPPPDFQFPQMENPELVQAGWHPHLLDYLYVSFTNSIAFSPTDAMPLTRLAKVLMLCEAGISAITVLLVAARAVNIFKSGRAPRRLRLPGAREARQDRPTPIPSRSARGAVPGRVARRR